ncbi:hypothetical protein HYPSUDRAFT_100513, partial [Hypholoma sublateritium FD-334 SS-4]
VTKDTDIICIQEPYIDTLGLTRATPGWTVIYPKNHRQTPDSTTRSVILVNNKMSTAAWTQIEINSVDITALQIKTPTHILDVYNIYNACEHNESTNILKTHL